MNRNSIASALSLTCTAALAHGAYVQPTWTRPTTATDGSAGLTTFQHWDNFTSPTANTPDMLPLANPNGVPNAFDANAPANGAIVTTSKNIYAGSGIIRMNTVVPSFNRADATSTKFLLQITTTANALFDEDGLWTAATPDNPTENDFSRLLVNGQRVDGLPSFEYERLFFQRGSSATSFTFERAIEFELAGNAASYTIEFTAPRHSTSIAAIAVDTLTVVPEPATLAALGVVATAVVRRRRPAAV